MTIKWVKSDPLVMGGEPFCYGSRLTVRQLLEERRNGYAAAEFFDATGNLAGPGLTDAEAAMLPAEMRQTGVVV